MPFVLTPLNFYKVGTHYNHTSVINLVRLLLTLDIDGDASNGMTMPDYEDAPKNLSITFSIPRDHFESNDQVLHLLTSTTNVSQLVDPFTAMEHFRETLLGLGINVMPLASPSPLSASDPIVSPESSVSPEPSPSPSPKVTPTPSPTPTPTSTPVVYFELQVNVSGLSEGNSITLTMAYYGGTEVKSFGNGETYFDEVFTFSDTYKVTKTDPEGYICIIVNEDGLVDNGHPTVECLNNNLVDTDNDFIPDETDNCLRFFNYSQVDSDDDGVGDSCDIEQLVRVAVPPSLKPFYDHQILLNDLLLPATKSTDDTSSVAFNSHSAIAKAAAINSQFENTGVWAEVMPTVLEGTAMAVSENITGLILLNGVPISLETSSDYTSNTNRDAIVSAINAETLRTKVVAINTGSDERGIDLVTEDGANIVLIYASSDWQTADRGAGLVGLGSTLAADISEMTPDNYPAGSYVTAGLTLASYGWGIVIQPEDYFPSWLFKQDMALPIGYFIGPGVTVDSSSGSEPSDLDAGELKINGYEVPASLAEDDMASIMANSASAIAKVAAINKVSESTGVSAKINPNYVFGNQIIPTLSSGVVTINGYSTRTINTVLDETATKQEVVSALRETWLFVKFWNDTEIGIDLFDINGGNIVIEYDDQLIPSSTGLPNEGNYFSSFRLHSAEPIQLTAHKPEGLSRHGLSAGTFGDILKPLPQREVYDKMVVVNSLSAGYQLGITRSSNMTSGNGYRVGNIDLNGVEQTDLFNSLVSPPATPASNLQANELAAALNTLPGIKAYAWTQVDLSNINYPINGLIVNGRRIADSADRSSLMINLQAVGFSVSSPPADPYSITLTASSGVDIVINAVGLVGGSSFNTVGTGTSGVPYSQSSLNNTITTTGGVLGIYLKNDVSLASSLVINENVWGVLDTDSLTSIDDADHDFITDDRDNCPLDFNPQQLDSQPNDIGDACEL